MYLHDFWPDSRPFLCSNAGGGDELNGVVFVEGRVFFMVVSLV